MLKEFQPPTKLGEFSRKIDSLVKEHSFQIELGGEKVKFKRINLKKNSIGCIDPRSLKSEIPDKERKYKHPAQVIIEERPNDRIKFPGGTVGIFFVAAEAIPDLSADKIVDLVLEYENKIRRRTPSFHGDDHPNTCGCGHVAKAIDGKNAGISSQRAKDIKDAFIRKIRNGETSLNKAILTGQHEEEAVLIIKSSKGKNEKGYIEITETVKPDDPDKRFFIYDETASNNMFIGLANFAKEKGIDVTSEKLIDTARKQVEATVRSLAVGLPVFEIDLADKVARIEFSGFVKPALASAA